MKKISLLLMMTLFCIGFVSAQRTVTGTITDDTGEPLIGASVLVKGVEAVGVATEIDGTYSINVPEGATTLVFSYIGFDDKEMEIGSSSVIDVSMSEGLELDEVVVTAFGIKRDKKALGYSVTSIDEEAFQLQGESDPARLLSGKVAGVSVIPQGGFLGGATNVIVRSKGSITGSNQPLYVVDGSPYSGNIADIDPANIVGTSVLKGLAASVLYGQDGRNGVILITTKNGVVSKEKKTDITLTQNFTRNSVGNLPDFQNTYGNGADQSTFIGFFGTWGDRFDPNTQVAHYFATGRHPSFVHFPELNTQTVPYVAIPDNVNDFFGNGAGSTTSLNVNSSNNGMNVNLNLGYDDQNGYVDENTYNKFNAGLGVSNRFSDKFTLKGNVNFSKVDTETPDLTFFNLLMFIPRNYDIHNLPFESPIDGSNIYYRAGQENPRWILKNQNFTESRTNLFTTVNGVYNVTDDISLSYQAGYNTLTKNFRNWSQKGGVFGDNVIGWLSSSTDRTSTLDQNFQVRLAPKDLSDQFTISGLLGANYRATSRDVEGIYSSDQIAFGLLDHDNFVTHSNGGDFVSQNNVLGLYAQVDLSYDNFMYLSLSGRNDWASTLEKENRTLFYPSASLSLVLNEKLNLGPNVDYLKVRGGFASSAGFPNPYLTRNTLNANGAAFIGRAGTISTQNLSGFAANANLRPELAEELEFGVDYQMFKRRIALDFTWFKRKNEDQLLNVSRPISTGVGSSIVNAGRIDTWGTEIGLSLVPIRKQNFEWEIYTVFTAIENEVKSLPEDNLNISGGRNWAVIGQPLGIFRGDYAERDAAGNVLIQATGSDRGKIFESTDLKIIGDPNEDWRGAITNTVTYKNFSLSAQLEMVSGGDIWSFTTQSLLRRGVTTDTDRNRDGLYIIPGVLGDPETREPILENGAPVANNIQLGANDIYFLNTVDTDEGLIYDATTIRLRQARLAYRFDKKQLGNLPFQQVVVSLSGNNLWFETPNMPAGINIDPEVNTATVNGDQSQGVDFQNDPSYKKWTFSLQVKF